MLLPHDLDGSSYEIHGQPQSYEHLEEYFDGAKGKFEALGINITDFIKEVKKNFDPFLIRALREEKHISNRQVLSLRTLPYFVENSGYNFVLQPVEYYTYLAFSSFLDISLVSLHGLTMRDLYNKCSGTMDDGKTLLFPNSVGVSLNLVSYTEGNTAVIFQERNNSKTATTRIGLVSGASGAIDIPEEPIGSLIDLTSNQIIYELDEELGMTGTLVPPHKDSIHNNVHVMPGGFVISNDRLNPEFLFLGMTTKEFSDIEDSASSAKDSWEFKSLRSLNPSQVYRELLKFASNQESKLNPHAIVSMIATMNTFAIIHDSKHLVQNIWKPQGAKNYKLENIL